MSGPFRPPTGGPAGIPGQGGQLPHPTVGNLGLPNGGSPQQGQPAYQQPADQGQGWQMPPAPQQPQQTFQQPVPSNQQQPPQQPVQGYGQPAPQNQQHPTANFGQPQAPQPVQQQQQQQQRTDIPDNVILDGANVPPELRGRSWGQVKQIYGALASDFLMRQNGNGGQQQQQQQPRQSFQQQQAPVYEQGRPNGGQPTRQNGGTFWEDPEGTIGRIVDSRLAPVTQRTTAMAIQEAMTVARTSIADFDYLEPEIMTIVQGADAAGLTDPRIWQSAAELARGRVMGRGQYDPRVAQQRRGQPNQPGGDPNFQRGPGAFVPAPVSPLPVGQFFTEAPTPPQYPNQQNGSYAGGDIAQRVQALTNEQREYAHKMQMSLEDYVAWQGGVQQSTTVRRY